MFKDSLIDNDASLSDYWGSGASSTGGWCERSLENEGKHKQRNEVAFSRLRERLTVTSAEKEAIIRCIKLATKMFPDLEIELFEEFKKHSLFCILISAEGKAQRVDEFFRNMIAKNLRERS